MKRITHEKDRVNFRHTHEENGYAEIRGEGEGGKIPARQLEVRARVENIPARKFEVRTRVEKIPARKLKAHVFASLKTQPGNELHVT